MPKITKDTPIAIRPFIFHGLDLRLGATQATTDCPFCDARGKFYVSQDTGEYWCHGGSCNTKGNGREFLSKLHEKSMLITKDSDYVTLATERRLMDPGTLRTWGLCKSMLTGEWLCPSYSLDKRIVNLYRWAWTGERMAWWPVPKAKPEDSGHSVWGAQLVTDKHTDIYITEGLWDALCLWETLNRARPLDRDYPLGRCTYVATPQASLGASHGVIASPSCTSIPDGMTRVTANRRRVLLAYHSDHPRPDKTDPTRLHEPAGWKGMRDTCAAVWGDRQPPKEVYVIQWNGELGYDPELKSGYDIRDHLPLTDHKDGPTPPNLLTKWDQRVTRLNTLLPLFKPVPALWLDKGHNPSPFSSKYQNKTMGTLTCTDWNTVYNAWSKATKFTLGHQKTLAVMLASAASVELTGEQVWLKIMGPPSCGKTMFCSALGMCKEYVIEKDTITGLTSGTDTGTGENISFVIKMRNKAVIFNEGDTVAKLPPAIMEGLFSQLRTLFGRNLRTEYRNRMSMDHEGVNTVVMIAGTESLRALDASDLGDRFLIVRVMDSIDVILEREIKLGKMARFRQQMRDAPLVNGTGMADTPEMVEAKRLTGGYVKWLRENIGKKLPGIDCPDSALNLCDSYGTFVSYMRARKSKRQDEGTERELSLRLSEQLLKLGYCLAVVLGRTSLDGPVMHTVRSVALDSCRGKTYRACAHIASAGHAGLLTEVVVDRLKDATRAGESTLAMLRFLQEIGVVETETRPPGLGQTPRAYWRLTETFRKLWDECATVQL